MPKNKDARHILPREEWPYEVPGNWIWTRLEDIAEIIMGQSPPSESVTDDNHFTPLIGGAADLGDLCPQISRYTKTITKSSQIDDVILCIRATLGHPVYSDGIYCLGRGVAGIRSNICSKEIIKIFFDDFEQYLYDHAAGSTFVQVTGKVLRNMPFPLPPIPEQQRIVARIESLFAKLDAAERRIKDALEKSERLRASVLHLAFTGELTTKWRVEHDVEMDSWQDTTIGELCVVVRGGSPRPAGDPKYYGGNIPFMKVADITRHDTIFVSSAEYTIKEAGLSKTRIVDANTLLLTNSGATLGVPAICTFKTAFNDGIAAFLELEPNDIKFFYYFWRNMTKKLRNINQGAAQPNLNIDIIKSVKISLPTLPEQKEIVCILDTVFGSQKRVKEIAEQNLAHIARMKKSLLSLAFRGQLGTNNPAEESMESVLLASS